MFTPYPYQSKAIAEILTDLRNDFYDFILQNQKE